ncbi:MAG: uroporphyrinogen-III C-methyltransferase [Marinobacterium sp.]|nr:uroporphyrinogen-III C-methyltransferase [Marinobacterium sp.]
MSTTDNNKPGNATDQTPDEQKATDTQEQKATETQSQDKSQENRGNSRGRRGKRGGSKPASAADNTAADNKTTDTKVTAETKSTAETKASADTKTASDAKKADSKTTGSQTANISAEKPAEKQAAQSEPAAAVAAMPKQGATWPGKLALALSFAALGASGYLYWMSQQQSLRITQTAQTAEVMRSEVNAKVDSTINGARSDLSSNIAQMNSKLGQLQAQAGTDRQNVNELQDRLTRAMKQLAAKQTNTRKDWLLAEVEYLLRLANQRILMENTVNGALSLLKSADKILAETDDVTIYDIRKAVAADIAALEAVPQLDTEGLFLKLGAMNRQVAGLRVTPLSQQHQIPELINNLAPENLKASWSDGLQETWAKAVDKLQTLVVVQHRDIAVKPLLSPEQKYYLQQNLNLMLEQAQLALLQRRQDSYDSALKKAEEWLNTYFQQDDGTTQGLLRGIEEMKKVKVSPELPDISNSLAELKSYLHQMSELKRKGAA